MIALVVALLVREEIVNTSPFLLTSSQLLDDLDAKTLVVEGENLHSGIKGVLAKTLINEDALLWHQITDVPLRVFDVRGKRVLFSYKGPKTPKPRTYEISLLVYMYQSKLNWGFVTPLAIYSNIWSLNFLRASRTSGTCFLTIYLRRGASSERAVSFMSSNQLLMKIPLSGCSWKFSATLSTMMVLLKSLPILLRSLTKTGP